jgi:DNA-binding winged helix-turn-helix (wHTH) protein/tetratricopeptide (TPR) repeat protein
LHGSSGKIRLQGLPFQILAILADQPGEWVTRDELRQRLWPADTFVDFDHSINTAMGKLRRALGDDTEEPRYIETLPRHGYRLIAAVAEAAPQNGSEAENKKLWKIVVPSAVLLLGVLIAVWLFYPWRRARALTDKDTIVLADFDNKTGDTVFDDTLKQGLSVQLEQSPFLALVSGRRVNETLKLMGRPAGERLTPEVTTEVCQRTGGKAMLTGSIAALGSQYVIGLKAVNCSTGDVLAEAQEQAAGKEAVLKALDAAAVSMRSKLGESLSSVVKYATPVEEATTPSLDALKVYSLGVKTWAAKGSTAALPFFKRAAELDPGFAMAYAWMAVLYHDLNEITGTAENGRKAYGLREKVSERERFFIDSIYYDLVTEDLETGAQSDELWQQTYPRDDLPYIDLGFDSATLGNWEKALEEWRVAQRLDPDHGTGYYLLSLAYMSQNQLDEAEAVFKQAEERKLETELILQGRYWLAFLKGDTAQMAKLVSAATGKPGAEDLLLDMQADTEGWYGKLKSARELTRQAMDSAQRNDAKESAAGYQAEEALREVESGNREQARAEANAALKLAPNRDVRAIAALALARAGDTAAAEKLAAELDNTFPLDTLVQRYWLPTIRASVALERKDPNRAIELLKVAKTIELSSATADLTIFLCPVYVRGEAYLMLHDGGRAAAEFQKFIDHRGVAMNFPWSALARLGLARAYAMQGDTAKAKSAYQDFLALWKEADPDVPILKQARAEYAKLR